MNLPVIVLGAGGHSKVLLDALLVNSVEVLGITDRDLDQTDKVIKGVPILGDDTIIQQFSVEKVQLVNGLGSVSSTLMRQKIFETFKKLGYTFANVIHPSAIIASDVILNEGVQVMAGAVIQTGCNIGVNSIINTRASIDHDCQLGAHVHIAPGTTISGGVTIGSNVHIGVGATIIQGISLGNNSLIGAGTLVLKDVPENVTMVGVPAKIIKGQTLEKV